MATLARAAGPWPGRPIAPALRIISDFISLDGVVHVVEVRAGKTGVRICTYRPVYDSAP